MKKIAVDVCCPFCGHVSTVSINEDDYSDWLCGELAQNCFPYLNAFEREVMISGLCFKCQDEIFGPDEDEDCEPADIDNDCGFDPYMGCFTDDC